MELFKKQIMNKIRKSNLYKLPLLLLFAILLNSSCMENFKIDDQFNYAQSRSDDLKLSIYVTAHTVENLLTNEAGRREAISLFRCNGITKAYIEVYRSGLVVDKANLVKVRDFFLANDIEVVGGIATVPGGDFGVKQAGKLGWFNWQNSKTQSDLKEVIKMSAGVFDEFIVDDFLCTADTSSESKAAKGNKSWSEYRRDLMTELSKDIFIDPAKEINPDIKMIIKYPQWYDRFHLFGYELAKEPQLFDKVWVGTETRGQYTQRYGFVQPYEGFVNYRWIKDIAKEKIGGAWFDHGDCDANDFIEQAYQSVLAGAKEIVLFNYFNFVNGHSGHHLLRTQFEQLSNLANVVSQNPVEGVAGYKPINSDAGGDLYLMDFIGSLGIPLVPFSSYPNDAKVIFLPTQAAADKDIFSKVKKSIANGSTIIFTTGFLASAEKGEEFARLAGVQHPVVLNPVKADKIITELGVTPITHGLDIESEIVLEGAESLLTGVVKSRKIPFLIKSNNTEVSIFTLNSHTFDQKDFDKVGEVLLCPKQLGLLEIPRTWANTLRESFNKHLKFKLDAPTRVVIQKLGNTGWIIHNYNNPEVSVTLVTDEIENQKLFSGFTNQKLQQDSKSISLKLKPRSREWIRIL